MISRHDTAMSTSAPPGFRWHRYYVQWRDGRSMILVNLLNKAVIRVPTNSFDASIRDGISPSLTGERLNRMLIDQQFLVPAEWSDADLLSRWFRLFCDNSRVFEWILLLTLQCNLACKYCFQDAEPGFRRNDVRHWPRVLAWMQRAILHRRPRLVRVAFFGGEPLLELDVLANLAAQLQQTCAAVGSRWRCDLITNGYAFTESVCEQLMPLGLRQVHITLDGPQKIHDQRRTLRNNGGPTFDRILTNLIGASRHSELVLRVRTNVDEHNLASYPDLLEILNKAGLRERVLLNIVATRPSRPPLANWEGFCFNDQGATDALIACLQEAVARGFQVSSRGIESGPCGAITKGSLVFTPDGNLYKCPHLVGKEGFCLGNTLNDVSFDVLDAVLPSPWRECVECKYVPICAGGCRDEAIARTGNANAHVCRRARWETVLLPLCMGHCCRGD